MPGIQPITTRNEDWIPNDPPATGRPGLNETSTPQAENSELRSSDGFPIASQPRLNETSTLSSPPQQDLIPQTGSFNGVPVTEDLSSRGGEAFDQSKDKHPLCFSFPITHNASTNQNTQAASLKSFIVAEENGVLTIGLRNEFGKEIHRATISVDQIFSSSENIDLGLPETEEGNKLKNKIALFINILRVHKPNDSWQSSLNNLGKLHYINQIYKKISSEITKINTQKKIFLSMLIDNMKYYIENERNPERERATTKMKKELSEIEQKLSEMEQKMVALQDDMSKALDSKSIDSKFLSQAILNLYTTLDNINTLHDSYWNLDNLRALVSTPPSISESREFSLPLRYMVALGIIGVVSTAALVFMNPPGDST